MIKNLIPSLPEVGKIKIGMKGAEITSKSGKAFQPPKKLDHFIVTGLERGPDGNFVKNEIIHEKIGPKPKELNIRLLYDDPNLNFLTRYVCYDGTKLWCTGDGECASRITNDKGDRSQAICPCERLDPLYEGRGKCKPSGVLSVMLDESPIVGGVWKLRTTSYNSVTSIFSSMAMISRITGGVLAGIPLSLTFGKKTANIPRTGEQTTIPIIGLIFKGSVLELAESGQKTALEMAGYRQRIEYIEDIARKNLDKEMGLGIYTEGETDEDIAAEFYPEQVAECISEKQLSILRDMLADKEADEGKFCEFLKVESLEKMLATKYEAAFQIIKVKKRPTNKTPETETIGREPGEEG